MIVVKVRDRDIKAAPMGPVTTGSVGLPVNWHFDEAWDDLAKTAVFRVGNDGTEITVAVLEDLCLVPDELLVQANAGENLWIGVYGWKGTNANDTIVPEIAMPTIWTYTRIQDGSQPSGIEPPEGTPGWSAQIQNATDEALRVAHGVAADAAAGEFDGISPALTISEITHGHSVNITDRDHPNGQSFPVLDGASAYEQAVAGGYTGTEAQFVEDLTNFKTLSEQAANSAAAAAQSESNADASAQDAEAYAIGKRNGVDVGAGDPASNNNSKYYMELAAHCMAEADSDALTATSSMRNARNYASSAQNYAGQATSSASDAATAKDAAETAQEAAEEAAEDAEAYAVGKRGGTDVDSSDPAYHNNAKYYAEQAAGSATAASGSATSAASSATAAGNAQTAAETAQSAAEDAQEAAEAVLASIPSDYTELSEDVDDLKSAFDALLLDGVVPYYKIGDISGTRSVSKTIDIAPGAYIFSISNIVSTDVNTGTNRIIIAKNGTTVYDKTIARGAFSERIILSEGADTISVYASDNYAHSTGDRFTFYDVTFSVEDKNTTAITKIQSSISRDDDLLGTKNYFNYYDFVTGALTNTGAISANSSYVTTDFIPVIPGKRYTIVKTLGAAYTRYLCYYDADKVYIPDSYVSGVVQNLYIFQVPNGAAFLRISISAAVYNENPVFSLETNAIDSIRNIITPENQCFSYAGNQLDLALNNKYLASRYMYADGYPPSGKTAQGFAIYGKYLFQFFADDYCRVYDAENNGAIVAEFTAQCGHGNGVCFSEQFNSATDDFPIIYLSDINGNVYQCAISLTACTLIKTLYFDSAVFGFAPEIVCDGNDYYVFGKQSDSDYYSTAIISKVDISNLTDNGNSTYTPAVLDSFTVNVIANSILQGCKAKNGCIYVCSGGQSTSVMSNLIVIDCTSKTVVSTITDFPELVKIHELEDLEFVPNAVSGKYDIVVHVRLYGYFRFVF